MIEWFEVEYEMFDFMDVSYDINAAKRLLKEKQAAGKLEIEMTPLAPLAEFVPIPGKFQAFKNFVNWSKIEETPDHFDLSIPVILAYTPGSLKRGAKHKVVMPVDGNHRIAKAVLDGATEIPVVVLSPKETKQIIIYR